LEEIFNQISDYNYKEIEYRDVLKQLFNHDKSNRVLGYSLISMYVADSDFIHFIVSIIVKQTCNVYINIV